jgi:hypothetical protein
VILALNALTLVVPARKLALMARVNTLHRALHMHVSKQQARLRPPKRVGGREHHKTTAGQLVHRLALPFSWSLDLNPRDFKLSLKTIVRDGENRLADNTLSAGYALCQATDDRDTLE